MSVFDMYRDRAEEYKVTGKPNELIFATRRGRSTAVSSVNNDKSAYLDANTTYTNGDLCTKVSNGDSYFITAMQRSQDAVNCQMKKTNCVIDIVSIKKHFTNKANDYDYEVPIHDSITAFYEEISGKQQQFDMGIKASTTRRFIVPTMKDFAILDRIKMNGDNMMIEVINAAEVQGMLRIQTCPDMRKTKVV